MTSNTGLMQSVFHKATLCRGKTKLYESYFIILSSQIKFLDKRLNPVNWMQSKPLLMLTFVSLSAKVLFSGELV